MVGVRLHREGLPNREKVHVFSLTWKYQRSETVTAATDDFIVVCTRTVYTDRSGRVQRTTPWRGTVIRDHEDSSTVVMSAEDDDRNTCLTACEEFLRHYYAARERDAVPTA